MPSVNAPSMVSKPKTYGRKRERDLVASFHALAISPGKDDKPTPRLPLESISSNVVAKRSVAQGHSEGNRTETLTGKSTTCPPTLESAPSDLLTKIPEEPIVPKENEVEVETNVSVTKNPSTFDTSTSAEIESTKITPSTLNATQTIKRKSKRTKPWISNKEANPIITYDPTSPITALTSLPYVHPTIQPLSTFCTSLTPSLLITKIAQGSYATILRLSLKSSPSISTLWKLLPLKPRKGKGSRAQDQTFIEDAVAELKALAQMALVEGFVEFRSARVLRGGLPGVLKGVEREWAERNVDDGDGVRRRYEKGQMWLLVEMSDAGTDLETLLKRGFPDGTLLHKAEAGAELAIRQTWDIFWGTAEALARGEALASFEHRDLHPGNICISRRKTNSDVEDPMDESTVSVRKFTDLEVTIIDYTLSRARLENGEILANSMEDGSIFEQSSEDETDARQFDLYRCMRELMENNHNNEKTNTNGHDKTKDDSRVKSKWYSFVPKTNVLWLYHILRYLLDHTEAFQSCLSHDCSHVRETDFEDIGDVEERGLAKRLDGILESMQPEKMEKWIYASAGELVEEEILNIGELEPGLETLVVEEGFSRDEGIVSEVEEGRRRRRGGRGRGFGEGRVS